MKMRGSRSVRDLVIAALCMALGVVLPVFLHGVPNAGSVLLPMHFPVLMCGLLCGPVYGFLCGAGTPLLSALLTGMPGAAYLPSMLCELSVYGLLCGCFSRLIHTRNRILNDVLALLGAMLGGRVVYGLVNALIFRAGEYSLALWWSASFVTALPGILLQLVILPPLAASLKKYRYR